MHARFLCMCGSFALAEREWAWYGSAMGILSTAVLSLSMSADAFAVSVGNGVGARRPCLKSAMRTGAIFGTVEAITPVLGWLVGLAASRYIAEIDHWIAFTILGLIGGKLLYERHDWGMTGERWLSLARDAMAS